MRTFPNLKGNRLEAQTQKVFLGRSQTEFKCQDDVVVVDTRTVSTCASCVSERPWIACTCRRRPPLEQRLAPVLFVVLSFAGDALVDLVHELDPFRVVANKVEKGPFLGEPAEAQFV